MAESLDKLVPDRATGILKILFPKIKKNRDLGIKLIDIYNALIRTGLKMEYSTFKNQTAKLMKEEKRQIAAVAKRHITLADIHNAVVNAGFEIDYSTFEKKIAEVFQKNESPPSEPVINEPETTQTRKPHSSNDKPVADYSILNGLDQSDESLEKYKLAARRKKAK